MRMCIADRSCRESRVEGGVEGGPSVEAGAE